MNHHATNTFVLSILKYFITCVTLVSFVLFIYIFLLNVGHYFFLSVANLLNSRMLISVRMFEGAGVSVSGSGSSSDFPMS